MKTYLDCIPCFIKQSLEATRMVTVDKTVHAQVMKEVLKYLQTLSFDTPPPVTSKKVHAIVRKITKCDDPYKTVKDQSNIMAEKLYPQLKEMIHTSNDSLLTAIKFAIVGNAIDFGSVMRFNVKTMITDSLKKRIINTAYPRFKKVLTNAKNILYLADNAGEIFFDKLLLEELATRNKEITYAVKANPILNDATFTDAKKAGIESVAKVISADADQDESSPGILLKTVSKEFLEHFNQDDLVIAKGQGNYESLNEVKREIFFLLLVKCPLVAQDMDTKMGDLIFRVQK
jgi:uncharacterized protein with ATP-grasp and redox domains